MTDPYRRRDDPRRAPPPSSPPERGAPPPQQPPARRRAPEQRPSDQAQQWRARQHPPHGREPRRDVDRTPADESLTEILWLDQGHLRDDGRDEYRDDDGYGGDDEYWGDDEYGVDDEYDELRDDYADDDDVLDRAEPEYYDDERPAPYGKRRRRKRALGWVAALGVIVLLAGGAYFGARELLGFGYDDYTGTGESDVVIKVSSGDTTRQIASTLAGADVVASAEAFVVASKQNTAVRGVQPGYYTLRTKMSGSNAAQAIVADSARVGHFQVRPGLRLTDLTQQDDSVTKGVLSRLSQASCADLNGNSTCVSVDELSSTIAEADLAELGVPEWAAEPAAGAEGIRRIEGLVAPGHYNVRPGSTATELLRTVLTKSAARMRAAGLPDVAADTGYQPYEVLLIASLIQREGIEEDFGKVSRVIHNRLGRDMKLGLDSTVNYLEEAPTARTTDEERERESPYNTYKYPGLTPTPISAPSKAAIDAAVTPADGAWLYFVRCETSGKSCFSETFAAHDKKAADARARGVY